jgi:hypothetical protein
MEMPHWTTLMSRIVPQDADDLDALAGAYDPRADREGRELLPPGEAVTRPETALKRADAVCVGLRVTAPLADAADRALRLAAFAAERDVEIIVLAHAAHTGLERFGFRVERIVGDTPEDRARCEDQIRRLWNIELVL